MASEERTLQWWKDSVKNGLKFREKYAHSKLWEDYKSYYRHEFPSGIIPVNLVFSILRSTVPQVYFKNPRVCISQTKPGFEYELHARLVQDIDNWLLREVGVKQQIKKMIGDAFICGIANGFNGYDSQFGFDPSKAVDESGSATLTQFDKKGYRLEYNANVNPGMPWFLRARPEDVVYPWGCESADNAEWVAMRTFRPLEDIKKDRKYKNTDELTGQFTQQRTTGDGTDTQVTWNDYILTDREWVELWQVRDAKTGEIVCFSMNHDEFLRGPEEDPDQIEGLPVETLVFNPDPDFIYGIPDTRIIEPQLLELNEIRTQAMKHRRVDLVKLLYKKGVIKAEQMAKLLNEDVQAGVEVDTDAQDIKSVVTPFTSGVSGILGDLERAADLVRQDVREAVGFSRSATGEYQGKSHVSAKETEVVNWANQIRVDERRDMVADLLTNIVRKFNQTVFTRWTTSMVRSVVGPDGARWWLQFTPAEIRGEYNIQVDPTEGTPISQDTKKKDAIDMANGYAQMNMGLAKSGVPAPEAIQRAFFSQFGGIDMDRLMSQIQQMNQPPQMGAGMNPQQPVPVGAAAQLMQRGK